MGLIASRPITKKQVVINRFSHNNNYYTFYTLTPGLSRQEAKTLIEINPLLIDITNGNKSIRFATDDSDKDIQYSTKIDNLLYYILDYLR